MAPFIFFVQGVLVSTHRRRFLLLFTCCVALLVLEVTEELGQSKMTQFFAPEHVHLYLVQIVLGVRILRVPKTVFRVPCDASVGVHCKLWPQELCAHRASDDAKAKQSVVGHAQTDISRL